MTQNESITDRGAQDNAINPQTGKGTEKSSPIMKKRILVPGLIILLAVAAGVFWYVKQLGYVSTDDAFIDTNKLSVSTKMLGRIIDLTVDEGDQVEAGQLLVQLDSTDIKAREDQAQAMLDLAKETINLAQVNLSRAQDDFDRSYLQYKDNIIPKEEFDHAQKELEAAKAELNIDKLKIQTSEAQLNVIRTELQNTSVFSPMSGIVAKRWMLKGDVVQPGQPIFTVFDMKNIWVTANLEETKLAFIHIGDETEISVDAYPDLKFTGKVTNIGSNTASQFSLIPPSNASGNFTKVTQRVPIKISINPVVDSGQSGPPDVIKLLPGMSVEVKVRQDSNEQ